MISENILSTNRWIKDVFPIVSPIKSNLKHFISNLENWFRLKSGSVGTLSGLTYYALKLAGVKNVKLYSKSFREWKSLGKPKEEFKDANYWDLSAD